MTTASAPTALATAAAIRDGRTTSEQVVADCLARIADREQVLRAWAHLDHDAALAEARARDRQDPVGPLHGVPVGVKDIVDTADQPTAYGSPIHAGHRPDRDATAVARLRAAGAVVVGKTVTTEFALFAPGPTTNPHDPGRTPGGSSSGSAAAVAAGTVPLAVGTQTAGSVVRPASFCGVVGGKPTFGAVPVEGVRPCAPSLDTVGAIGTTVADVALALGVMADDVDGFTPVHLGDRPRIGFCRTPQWDDLPATTRSALEAGAQRLARVADVVDVALPADFAGLVDAQQAVMVVEAAEALAWERHDRPDQLTEQLRAYLDGASDRAAELDDALALARRCRDQLPEVFADVDALFAPSVLGEAPPIETTGDPLLCRMWTLLGTPTVAVPGLVGPEGLPLGSQVIAVPGRDATALAAADLASQALAPTRAGKDTA